MRQVTGSPLTQLRDASCVNVFWDAVRTLQSGKYESIVILEHNESLAKHCQLSVFAVVTINFQQNSRPLVVNIWKQCDRG